MDENGVKVGFKEIYDEMKGVSAYLIRLDARMKSIEEKFEKVNEVDERSRQAYEMSLDNAQDIKSVKNDFEKYMKTQSKRKDNDKRNTIAIIAIAAPVILAVMPILVQYYTP